MKLVSGSYKLVLAQFAELQAFSQVTSDVQDETKQRLAQLYLYLILVLLLVSQSSTLYYMN